MTEGQRNLLEAIEILLEWQADERRRFVEKLVEEVESET